jgi:predicted transporter
VSAIAVYIGLSLASFYLLWVLFLAVMNLKRVKDAGLLHRKALILGTPVLILGLLVDALVNWFVMTLVLLELPQEVTVTARLKRHNKATGGWRKKVVGWFRPLLDPFDPSGGHI